MISHSWTMSLRSRNVATGGQIVIGEDLDLDTPSALGRSSLKKPSDQTNQLMFQSPKLFYIYIFNRRWRRKQLVWDLFYACRRFTALLWSHRALWLTDSSLITQGWAGTSLARIPTNRREKIGPFNAPYYKMFQIYGTRELETRATENLWSAKYLSRCRLYNFEVFLLWIMRSIEATHFAFYKV
jgi:hypothetical protein